MTTAHRAMQYLGANAQLTQQIFKNIFRKPIYWDLVVTQIYLLGVKSLPLILIIAASIGMVMALQFGIGLEKFGGKLYIPKIVTISIIRELGPVFASLMFAARVGAGITSEVGSMVVTQQIDAIRALGTSPIKKIVVPRFLACLITLPILGIFANTIGVFGGMFVGAHDLNLNPGFYYQKIKTTITLADYLSGFGKTFFFAIFIAVTACYCGLNVEKKGTKAVGVATTKCVVISSILIVVGDYFLTKLFWIIER